MDTEETRLSSEVTEKVIQIFSHFMARVARFEEVAAAGNGFLISFRQGLEFIRRPSIDITSELVENVIKANETDRVQSYVKAGCMNVANRVDNLDKSKGIIDELECLVEDANHAIEAANETLHDLHHENQCPGSDPLAATCSQEEMESSLPQKPKLIDYAAIVATVYCMVKQDYVMQEKIVSSLGLKTSSGELESYCLMWSLRPFVNDEIMHQAWRLIP